MDLETSNFVWYHSSQGIPSLFSDRGVFVRESFRTKSFSYIHRGFRSDHVRLKTVFNRKGDVLHPFE